MAAIISRETLIVLACRNLIRTYRQGCDHCEVITVPSPPKNEGKAGHTELSPVVSGNILSLALSPAGTYLVVADDNKLLHLYGAGNTWRHLSTRETTRRCTRVVISPDERAVLTADKTGDVYSFSTTDAGQAGALLLGHLSILLDVVFSKGGDYVVTCDRDEKVRVGHYPHAYHIHSFCLGHTSFVSRLACVAVGDAEVIVSGSEDGTIRIWTMDGKQLQCVKLNPRGTKQAPNMEHMNNAELLNNMEDNDSTRNTEIDDATINVKTDEQLLRNSKTDDSLRITQTDDSARNTKTDDSMETTRTDESTTNTEFDDPTRSSKTDDVVQHNLQDDRTSLFPVVKHLCFSPHNSLLAVSFYRYACIQLYHLRRDNPTSMCDLVCEVDSPVVPWDMCVVGGDTLCVVLPDAARPLWVMRMTPHGLDTVEANAYFDETYPELTRTDQLWDFLRDADASIMDPNPNLAKVKVDYTVGYYERKRQRLQGGGKNEAKACVTNID